jgi:cysteinyl-tRNA synthetase
MSKSLGNFTMIKEVLAAYSPEVIRMFLLSKHYRSPIDYNEDSMKEVSTGLDRIYAFLGRVESVGIEPPEARERKDVWQAFAEAMDDDFNSARGLAIVFEAVKKGNKLLDEAVTPETKQILAGIYGDIKAISKILGIFLMSPAVYFEEKKEKGVMDQDVDPEKIQALIEERNQARAEKNFARADQIREQLLQLNIILEDGPGGTTWKFE